MNKKSFKVVISASVIFTSNIIINEQVKASVIRKFITTGIGGIRNLFRSRSYSLPNILKPNTDKSKVKQIICNKSYSLEDLGERKGLNETKKHIKNKQIKLNVIGSGESNIGALRSSNNKLGSVYGSYGANLEEFDLNKISDINPNYWYLQHSGYYKGEEETLVSVSRPVLRRSINGTEIDMFEDQDGNIKKSVHQGVGMWIRGSVLLDKKDSEKKSTIVSNKDILKKTKKDGIPSYRKSMDNKNLNVSYNAGKKGLGSRVTTPTLKFVGKDIENIDADKIPGTINTVWWYMQYEDENGNTQNIISKEKPRIIIQNGLEYEMFLDNKSGSEKVLKNNTRGVWHMGQKILEEIQLVNN